MATMPPRALGLVCPGEQNAFEKFRRKDEMIDFEEAK